MRPPTAARPRLTARYPLGVLRRRRGAGARRGGRFVPLSLIFRSARAPRAASTTQVIRAGDGARIEISPRFQICLRLGAILREVRAQSSHHGLAQPAPAGPRERVDVVPAARPEAFPPPAVLRALSWAWLAAPEASGPPTALPPHSRHAFAAGERGRFEVRIEWAGRPSAPRPRRGGLHLPGAALYPLRHVALWPGPIGQAASPSRQLPAPAPLRRLLGLTRVAASTRSDRKPPRPLVRRGERQSVGAWLPGTAHHGTNSAGVARLPRVATRAAEGEFRPSRLLEHRHSGRSRERSAMAPGRPMAALPAVALRRFGLATAKAVPGARAAERGYDFAPPARGAEPSAGWHGSPTVQFLPIEIHWCEARRPEAVAQVTPRPVPVPQPPPDLARLTREVSRELEKRLRVERQRHGRL